MNEIVIFDADRRRIEVRLEGDLERESTIRKFRIVRQEGKRQVSRELVNTSLHTVLRLPTGIFCAHGVKKGSRCVSRIWPNRMN
jgi:hypothetical protein